MSCSPSPPRLLLITSGVSLALLGMGRPCIIRAAACVVIRRNTFIPTHVLFQSGTSGLSASPVVTCIKGRHAWVLIFLYLEYLLFSNPPNGICRVSLSVRIYQQFDAQLKLCLYGTGSSRLYGFVLCNCVIPIFFLRLFGALTVTSHSCCLTMRTILSSTLCG